jgi:homoserine O-acetyltransferase
LPFLAAAALQPIPSIWGHRAGNPIANPADMVFIRNEVMAWLAR